MTAARVLIENWALGSGVALTASSSAAATPVGAIVHSDRQYVWRSNTDTTEQSIDIDLGSTKAVTAVALANLRLIGTGAVVVENRGTGASPGVASTLTTLTAQNTYTRVSAGIFASASLRHLRLRWTNPTSANDYAELGFVGIGPYYEPVAAVRANPSAKRHDPSALRSSVDGQADFTIRTRFDGGRWRAKVLEPVLEELMRLEALVGIYKPWFLLQDLDRPWTHRLVRFKTPLEWTFLISGTLGSWYDVSFDWEEAR